MNKEKCSILCINQLPGGAEPTLYIEDHQLKTVDVMVYVGDDFNKRGDNNDLMESRATKARKCIQSCFAECCDITLGQYSIQVLMILYRQVFLQTILFNSGAWCNLTDTNMKRLKVIQMKYLKRLLHAPRGTPNVAILRELGVLPIEAELHIRQLSFLHHTLTLSNEDPVRMAYEQQKRFIAELSWYNEVQCVLLKYGLTTDESIIGKMKIDAWTNLVKKKVTAKAVQQMNVVCNELSKMKQFPTLQRLQLQKYLHVMKPYDSRLFFRIKSNMIEMRAVCYYRFKDISCRLCGEEDETLHHVLNVCKYIERDITVDLLDLHKGDNGINNEIVKRVEKFRKKAKESEDVNKQTKSQQDSKKTKDSDAPV